MAWVPGDLAPAPVRAVSGRSGAGWPNSSPRLVSVHPLPASPAHPTRLLLAGSAAPTLMATPAGLTVDHSRLGFAWQAALPRDGDGQGNGGGQAKGRYGDALEPRSHAAPRFPQASRSMANLDRGRPYGLAPNETQALIERGWKGPKTQDRFKNHGQRTRTTVELAKRLGYSTRVGAMQANFGIPFENGVADLQDQLAEARDAGNQAEVERLETEVEAAIAAAKPGKGPDNSWATADLDVNDEGTVDARDLDALDQQEATPSNEPAS
jgi:hypothetical protein